MAAFGFRAICKIFSSFPSTVTSTVQTTRTSCFFRASTERRWMRSSVILSGARRNAFAAARSSAARLSAPGVNVRF